MEQELHLVNLALVEAHLARWAVQLGNGVMPRGLTRALEDFHRRWLVQTFWIASPETLTTLLIRLFSQIPEIQAWSARQTSPISLPLLAQAVTQSSWRDLQLPPLSPWQRFWNDLRRPRFA